LRAMRTREPRGTLVSNVLLRHAMNQPAIVFAVMSVATTIAFANDPRPPTSPDDKLIDACVARAPAKQDPRTRSAWLAGCVAETKHAMHRDACTNRAPKHLDKAARTTFVDTCVADTELHDRCAAEAPTYLEVTASWKVIDACVAETKLRDSCAAQSPADVDTCVADAKLRDRCAAKAPANLEMSSRHEYIDSCVADTKRATADKTEANLHDVCAAKAPANLEMSSRHEYIATCIADAKARAAADSKLRATCGARAHDPDPRSRQMFIDMCVDNLRYHPELQ